MLKKLLIPLSILIAVSLPITALANFPASWNGTSTTGTIITPNPINGNQQTVQAQNYIGTSTATSTFQGGIQSPCFSTGTGCISGSGGSGSVTSIGTTFPITGGTITTSGTLSFGGLSTSTAAVVGNIPYFTGVNTFGNVATTTASCSGSASCTAFTIIGSSPVTITGSGGTNYWTNSSTNTYLNTGINAEFPSFTATSTTVASNITDKLNIGSGSALSAPLTVTGGGAFSSKPPNDTVEVGLLNPNHGFETAGLMMTSGSGGGTTNTAWEMGAINDNLIFQQYTASASSFIFELPNAGGAQLNVGNYGVSGGGSYTGNSGTATFQNDFGNNYGHLYDGVEGSDGGGSNGGIVTQGDSFIDGNNLWIKPYSDDNTTSESAIYVSTRCYNMCSSTVGNVGIDQASPNTNFALDVSPDDGNSYAALFEGNVGIGSTTASFPLSVVGAGDFSGNVDTSGSFNWTATSSGQKGINITSGCYAINGSCIGGSGGGSGTVTSVDMTVPTGLTISGNPITSSGTLALSLTGGYVIPLTASTTQWNNLYNASTTLPYVISIATNNGLTGGTITSSGTVGLNIAGLSTNALTTWNGSTLVATGTPSLTVGYLIGTSTATSTLVGGLATNLLNVTSATASSTFANGINILAGCFSINNVCVGGSGGGGSGTVGSGTTGQFPYYAAGGTTLTATSTVFVSTASAVGISTSTPVGGLDVNGGIFSENQTPATTTTMTVNLATANNEQLIKIGSANIAVTFTNACQVPGKSQTINVLAPASGLIGSTTFAGGTNSGSVIWAGGVNPGNDVLNGLTDSFVFQMMATSSACNISASLQGTY